MGLKGIAGSAYNVCEWIVRLAYANVLWVLFTCLGFIVLGITPATVALFTIARKWVQGETELPVFQQFWTTYKEEFLKSNILGALLFVLGSILVFDLYFFMHQDGLLSSILFIVFIAISFNYLVMLMYIFPVYVHYDIKLLKTFKFALIIGMSHPFQSFSILICAVATYFIIYYLPAALLFLSIAPFSAFSMLMAQLIFKKLEAKELLLRQHENNIMDTEQLSAK